MRTQLPMVEDNTLCECGDRLVVPGLFMVQYLSQRDPKVGPEIAKVEFDPLCEECAQVVDADDIEGCFVLRVPAPSLRYV